MILLHNLTDRQKIWEDFHKRRENELLLPERMGKLKDGVGYLLYVTQSKSKTQYQIEINKNNL